MGWLGPYTWFSPSKPGLQSRAHCGIVCALSITNSSLLKWPIVSLLILFYFILFSNIFCILVHNYTLCFIGSPCYNVGCYNYNTIWPYNSYSPNWSSLILVWPKTVLDNFILNETYKKLNKNVYLNNLIFNCL